MRKFYNQYDIKIKELKNYETKKFELDVPSLYGILYFEKIDAAIQAFINEIRSTKPTLIKIVGDFDMLKNADELDIKEFIDTIIALFIDALIEKDSKTEKEKHILIMKQLNKTNLKEYTKIKIRNFKSKFDSWNIIVVNKQDNKMYEVF